MFLRQIDALKNSKPRGQGGGVWRGWDGFPSLSRFWVLKSPLSDVCFYLLWVSSLIYYYVCVMYNAGNSTQTCSDQLSCRTVQCRVVPNKYWPILHVLSRLWSVGLVTHHLPWVFNTRETVKKFHNVVLSFCCSCICDVSSHICWTPGRRQVCT